MAHMADAWFWGLLASLILLAIGISLKSAADAQSLKLANDDITRPKKKIETLNQVHNDSTANTSKAHIAEVEKLTGRIRQLETSKKTNRPRFAFAEDDPIGSGSPNDWMR